MKKPTIKYIQGDKENGIEYDWKLIRKEYKKLECPPDVYDPSELPLNQAKYFVCLSERNVGKTTNWLLLGMVMNKLYGTEIQYIRQREDMIMPKSLKDLFSTILRYNYIEKLTDGEWDCVFYKSRRFYYARSDDSGKITDVAPHHFMFCCNIEKGDDLKSSYNAPLGDLLLFDEFVGKYYANNEYIAFCQLAKTIIRDRRSPIFAFCANTINPHSPYFNEIEIFDTVQHMVQGDKEIVKSSKGTIIYVELIGATIERKRKKSIVNQLFFGFKNPLLGSITGESWSIDNYQHIPEITEDEPEPQILSRCLYIYHSNKYVRLDIVQHVNLGICIYAHWATKTHEDSVILTVEDRFDKRYRYGLGSGRIEKFIRKCYAENRFYYATNDVGCFIENYIKNYT